MRRSHFRSSALILWAESPRANELRSLEPHRFRWDRFLEMTVLDGFYRLLDGSRAERGGFRTPETGFPV